jgi:anti-sigma regulatory factor (Ser/Thr protein kinase)
MVLGALPSAVPCARRHVTAVLRYEWNLAAVAETMEHVVAELVTNAVQASEGLVRDNYPFPPTIQVWLSADQDWVIVQVWDANNQMPEKLEPDLETEGGRGLVLVDALSESCGVYRLEGGNGKIVWARVRTKSGSMHRG